LKKNLFKDKSTATLCWTISGIPQYFDIDRMLQGYAFGFFTGIIAYIAASVILPDKSEIGHEGYNVH